MPTTAAVDELRAFPFLIDKLEDLKLELPTYMAVVEDVSNRIDILQWWKDKEQTIPHWSAA